jgi:DedD protein
MAKRLTDDEQNLRRKARRRLIGAVALTLVVVVVLPMVLDSEPKPTGRDIELNIPDPDKVGEFVPGVAVSAGVNGNAPAVSAVGVASPIPVEKNATGTEVKAMAKTDTTKPVAASENGTAVAGKARTDAPVKSQPVVSKPANPKVTDKPASAVAESYVAQVGAYSSSGTAKQELAKLKKWGFRAYIEKAGDTIRVRVGPYPDRDKAEKAGHLLEKHGLHPVVMSAK